MVAGDEGFKKSFMKRARAIIVSSSVVRTRDTNAWIMRLNTAKRRQKLPHDIKIADNAIRAIAIMAADGGLSLLTVPPEVFERIAQQADPQDLLSLRLVCKEAAARVFRTYTQAHFSERAFLVCYPQSFYALAMIAESELLGMHMKKIVFCLDEISHPDDHRTLLWLRNGTNATTGIHEGEAKFLRECQQTRQRELYEIQRSAAYSKADLHVLTLALCRLRQKGVRLRIEIVETDATKKKARFHQSLQAETGRALSTTGESLFRNSRTVFDALSLSGVQVDDLQITFSGWGMPFYDLASHRGDIFNMTTIFTNLRRLDMWVWAGSEVSKKDEIGFAQSLAKASQIEDLRLQIYGCMEGPFLGLPFLDLTFPLLKLFRLWYWTFPYHAMVSFLRRHAKLRKAEFNCCYFTVEEKDIGLKKLWREDLAAVVVKESDLRDFTMMLEWSDVVRESFWAARDDESDDEDDAAG